MPACKECQFYEQVNETKGNCFGHEVSGNNDVKKCPAKAFKPRLKRNKRKMGNYINRDIKYIGCCGAYCKTCRPFIEGFCKGCKLGYDNGQRDINKAKCEMKICCFKKNLKSCADCKHYYECKIIRTFHNKNGFKYKKYKQAIEFIIKNGYIRFLSVANTWKGAFGRYNVSGKTKKYEK
jgi:hypothetical protein